MTHSYACILKAIGAALLLAPGTAALAQAPVITGITPLANARAAARTAPVTVSFNQPLTTSSAGALKVFSAQRGGLRTRGATPAVVSGSTLSFAPSAYAWMPGETVSYTVTTAAAGNTGVTLARPRTGQFMAAVSGTGWGNFVSGSNPAVASYPNNIAAGDVDGDGDLDFLTTGGSVSVRLNGGNASGSNTGVFSGGQNVAVGSFPSNVILGDVDGDGDLDFLAVNANTSGTVSVRLNGGDASGSSTGRFSGGQEVAVGSYSSSVALGDVDGDGDLDMLTANGVNNTVSIRLNGGNASGSNTGFFSGSQEVPVGSGPRRVTVADIDGDGDLDLLTANELGNTLSIRLNGGDASGSNTGVFANGSDPAIAIAPISMAVGDVDGDGDLDLAIANQGFNITTVSIRLNGGNASGSNTGTFSNGTDVTLSNGAHGVVLADADSDGDLDLFAANYGNSVNLVSIRLNGGDAAGSNTGRFSNGQDVAVGNNPYNLAVGDVDGDGDLDLLTPNYSTNTVSIRLNGGTSLATVAEHLVPIALTPNPAHTATTLTGTAPHAPISVLDALGRPVLTATADASGTARFALPAGLPAGVYLVRCGAQVRRLAVE